MVFPQVIAAFHAVYHITGLLGNLLVMVTIILESWFYVMRYILLASLALSDFLLLVLVNSFRIGSIAKEHWLYGQTMCYLNTSFARYFYINTVLHLVAVSYDRYLAIVKSPLTYNGIITKTRVVFLALIWIVPVIPVSILGWGKYVYKPEVFFCEQERAVQSESIRAKEVVFPVATLLVPLLIIVFLNTSVYKTARRQINAMEVQVGGPVDAESTQRQEIVSRRLRDRKVALMYPLSSPHFWCAFFPSGPQAFVTCSSRESIFLPKQFFPQRVFTSSAQYATLLSIPSVKENSVKRWRKCSDRLEFVYILTTTTLFNRGSQGVSSKSCSCSSTGLPRL